MFAMEIILWKMHRVQAAEGRGSLAEEFPSRKVAEGRFDCIFWKAFIIYKSPNSLRTVVAEAMLQKIWSRKLCLENPCRGSWGCGRGSIAKAVAEGLNNFLLILKEKKTETHMLMVNWTCELSGWAARRWNIAEVIRATRSSFGGISRTPQLGRISLWRSDFGWIIIM